MCARVVGQHVILDLYWAVNDGDVSLKLSLPESQQGQAVISLLPELDNESF